jgi:hypothetical protein
VLQNGMGLAIGYDWSPAAFAKRLAELGTAKVDITARSHGGPILRSQHHRDQSAPHQAVARVELQAREIRHMVSQSRSIGEPTLADAISDRLVHNAYEIELKGPSLRKENAAR